MQRKCSVEIWKGGSRNHTYRKEEEAAAAVAVTTNQSSSPASENSKATRRFGFSFLRTPWQSGSLLSLAARPCSAVCPFHRQFAIINEDGNVRRGPGHRLLPRGAAAARARRRPRRRGLGVVHPAQRRAVPRLGGQQDLLRRRHPRFETGFYDVVQVGRREYEECTADDPYQIFRDGPATVPLDSTGVRYYVCTVGNYCSLGVRLYVTVQRH